MMRRMQVETVELPLARPFTIARGSRTSVTVVRVTLEQQGVIGQGESTPTLRYNQSADSVSAQLSALQAQVEAGMTRDALQKLLPAGSARNALDCAFWRLEAALNQQSLWQMLRLSAPQSVTTAETLSLDSVENMTKAAEDAVSRGAILLKIKLDGTEIVEKVAAIRQVAPEATLIIDANEAWSGIDLASLFTKLSHYRIAMIEQPLPADQDSALQHFTHAIPVCADESCHQRGDIAALRDRYEMINIKLDKCGGLTEALAMLQEAQQQQLRVMIGCMLGSSLAMEAALPLTLAAEHVDLDGPIWLAADSSPHLRYYQGKIWP